MPIKITGMLIREKLLRLFDELAEEKIIYVCAPAGYGKTSAVRQWLDRQSHAWAAIALDERDNSCSHFCERFCAKMYSCQTQNTLLESFVSHPAFGEAPDEFTLRAIAALSEKSPLFFVIDDLHILHDEKVLGLLLIFLKRLPENCRIILISRKELPTGFSDLWIKGHLQKVTLEQLRFSAEDVALLYKKRGHPITSEQADSICRFTNGWPIGINALLLSGGEPYGESFEYLEEYIRKNIWNNWDEPIREFMLRTAVANELEPDLCAVLSGVPESEKMLRGLMLSGAFIFQSSDGIYHYHHLFHDFLRHMLRERGDNYIYPLLKKEGYWHLSRCDFFAAIDCFAGCEDYEGIEKCFGGLVNSGYKYFQHEKIMLLAHKPAILKAAQSFPYIYSILAWAAFNEGRAEDMARYADVYYKNQTAISDPRLRLNVVFVRFIDFRFSLRELAETVSTAFCYAELNTLSGMGVSIGTINQNNPLLHCGTRDFSECAIGDIELNLQAMYAAFGSLFGKWAKTLLECIAAGLFYERGQLEKAYSHALAANAAITGGASPELKFFTAMILVYVHDALDEKMQAKQIINSVEAMMESEKAYYLNRNFKALKTRRMLAKGDIKAAGDWLAEYKAALHDLPSCFGLYCAFTTCRAYITTGDYDSAILLLTKVLKLVKTFNRPLGIIETRILLAIAYWKKKRGFQNEALRHLESAVSLAYGYEYTQLFANEGAELAGMLYRLQKRVEQPGRSVAAPASFVRILCMNAKEHHSGGLTSGQLERPEKYTDKQKAVMKLLCEGKSYREITVLLGIKLPTLRSHIALIYKKLDVTNEADAIIKIKSQGILNEL